MTRPRLLLLAFLLAATTAAAGCPFGTTATLVASTNARVIVTGTELGDELLVSVAGRDLSVTVDAPDPIIVYFELDPGTWPGALEVTRGDERRCASFELLLPEAGASDIAGVDLSQAPLCDPAPVDGGPDPDPDGGPDPDPDPDGGPTPEPDAGPFIDVVFDLLVETETIVDPCLLPPCDRVSELDGEGTLTVTELELTPQSAVVPGGDLSLLIEDVLSDEADLLFAGADPDCAQPRPPPADLVTLERTIVVDGEVMTAAVDVGDCTTGVAALLRARLAFFRASLLDIDP